jgi:hypothetical protein
MIVTHGENIYKRDEKVALRKIEFYRITKSFLQRFNTKV